MQHLLEKDRSKRIGAVSFESFISDPFFRPIDFDALVAKEIQPIFVPSSEKTNFDATYDLEELLLEEAPLEARARRQKPRAELKDDATEKEIRTDELHRMIETLFEPFDYTTVRCVCLHFAPSPSPFTADSNLSLISSSEGTAVAALEARPDWPRSNNTNASKSSNEDKSTSRAPNSAPSSPPVNFKPSTSHSNHSDYFSAHDHDHNHNHNRRNYPPMPNSKQQQQQQTGSRGSREHSPSRLVHTTGTRARAEPPRNAPNNIVGGTRHLNSKTTTATTTTTPGGGMQVVLDSQGSWSHVTNKSSTIPTEGLTGLHVAKATQQHDASNNNHTHLKPPHGVLGFLSRKKGREKSPKPQENGVLGKEGARVVVSGGK